MLDLQEEAANRQERKKKVLERTLKQIVELSEFRIGPGIIFGSSQAYCQLWRTDKKQAKEERAIEAEMEQVRDKAKAKVRSVFNLDPITSGKLSNPCTT